MLVDEAWVLKSRLGGIRRNRLHGNPGTPEGRSKGGRIAIRSLRQNPRTAKNVGFVLRKKITYPKRSKELAEFFGVILGDGGIPSGLQLTISFNKEKDEHYAEYLGRAIKKLFGLQHHISARKNCNGADVVVSSASLIDFLLKQGLVKGNKVKNQVDVPCWIQKKSEYRIACVRGLMDTDGGFYWHRYRSRGREYEYLKLCFTNASRPLLNFMYAALRKLGIRAYLNGIHVSVYALDELKKYFFMVGSHNPKHIAKFKTYLVNRLGEVAEWPKAAHC